jgi:hypothetical protein
MWVLFLYIHGWLQAALMEKQQLKDKEEKLCVICQVGVVT